MFSGRRRSGDFHDLIRRQCKTCARSILILSLDIVSSCDLAAQSTIDFLAKGLMVGIVAAVLSGPPCETFSVARHSDSPGPLPARTQRALWGCNLTTNKIVRQVTVANSLMLNNLFLLVVALLHTAAFIMEHPAKTLLHQREHALFGLPPSIWDTSVMTSLLQHPRSS